MASSVETKMGFPKVFISYNHKDQLVALKIKEKLVGVGFAVIIDVEAMSTGENISEFIKKCIQQSGITLSLISANSLKSAWVSMETIWSYYDVDIRGRYFMPCYIDTSFLDYSFVSTTHKVVEEEIGKIDEEIIYRRKNKIGIDDIQDGLTRLSNLSRELPSIIGRLRKSLCANLCDDNFDYGMEKVINDIKKNYPNMDEKEEPEQQKLKVAEAEQKGVQQIENDKNVELNLLRKQKLPEILNLLVFVKNGIFTMGSPENEVDRRENETQHQVKFSDFYISKYAVSVADFKKFIDEMKYVTDAEKGDGSYSKNGYEWNKQKGINWRFGVSGKERTPSEYDHPVVHVSWIDAVAYCEWLYESTGKKFRLPTEAEWEYACRVGPNKPFSTGENLTTDQANYHGNHPYNNNKEGIYRENTVPINHFQPNVLGLYNMHGNVWEWCNDRFSENYYEECKAGGTIENPKGPSSCLYRVIRGSSWYEIAKNCRATI